jgi:hydrogenase/urease accessory protein HupE
MIRILLAILLGLTVAAPAAADTLRPGYVEFTQVSAQDWRLTWKLPVQADLTPDIQPVLPANCAMTSAPKRTLSATALLSRVDVSCTASVAGGRIGIAGLNHAQTDVIVRVAPLGRPVQTLRLTPAQPDAFIAARPSRWQVAGSYFAIGINHILSGYDHLLFVLAFVLLLGGVARVAVAVTAFTVAHSVTLVGTTLGYMGLPPEPVESVIALSIMFLAVEILKKRPDVPRLSERAPWIVAFGFGLLHGFGFAGALSEIGLPEGEVPTALLAFNLGVEAGQIAIVAAGAAVMAALRRLAAKLELPFTRAAAYAIGMIAGIWFVERTFG